MLHTIAFVYVVAHVLPVERKQAGKQMHTYTVQSNIAARFSTRASRPSIDCAAFLPSLKRSGGCIGGACST